MQVSVTRATRNRIESRRFLSDRLPKQAYKSWFQRMEQLDFKWMKSAMMSSDDVAYDLLSYHVQSLYKEQRNYKF